MQSSFIENNKYINHQELMQKITIRLDCRIKNNANYSTLEISEISTKNSALCPSNFEISDKARELLRVLIMLSRCELKLAKHIRSHRKFIGPLIVFFKKLTWPLVHFHLKDTFESIQQFNSWTVYGLAQQIIEVEVIKQKLKC